MASTHHLHIPRLESRRRRNGEFTERPKLGAVKVQQPDTNNTNDAQPAEQAGAPGHAEVAEEWVGKQDAPAGEGAAEEVVCGEEAGGVHGVGQGDVDEDALHDDEDGATVDGDADGGDDPVDGGAGGPGEEEEADRGSDGGREGGYEALLLLAHAVLCGPGVLDEVEVGDVAGDAEEAGDEDAEKDEADLAEVHAVVDGVDEGEDLEDWDRSVYIYLFLG